MSPWSGRLQLAVVPIAAGCERGGFTITEVSVDRLVDVGRRLMSGPLAEQAGYTLGIAALDGEDLSRLLPNGLVGEVEDGLAKVVEARHVKELLADEAKDATRTQNGAFKQSKVWRRAVSKLAINAVEMGKSMPAMRFMRIIRSPRSGIIWTYSTAGAKNGSLCRKMPQNKRFSRQAPQDRAGGLSLSR